MLTEESLRGASWFIALIFELRGAVEVLFQEKKKLEIVKKNRGFQIRGHFRFCLTFEFCKNKMLFILSILLEFR